MRRKISLSLACIFAVLLLSGCGRKVDKDNIVNISILNSKPEISAALEEALDEFEETNKDIRVKVIEYSQTGSYKDKLGSMNAVDNAPTLSLVDAADIKIFSSICANLSNEKWVNDISGGVSDIAKNDKGEVVAFPFSTEGAGFIYNKNVTDAAGVDVNNIKSISELEDAFKKIKAIGKGALIITNEEWSLGDHFLSTFYAVDMENSGLDNKQYFNKLKSDSEYISNNKILNGLLDTFDIMKKYNIYSENPLSPSYAKCSEALGSGQVGFWYMGNWASNNILAQSGGSNDFGFIPVPVSNISSDKGNNEIAVGITKYFIVNGNSSPNQIEAAKRLLNYIVYDKKGNEFIAKDCGVIPAFGNIEVPKTDPLVNEIVKYRSGNKTLELMNSYLPSNNSKVVGLALRKYLNNEISRNELIENIKSFWTD